MARVLVDELIRGGVREAVIAPGSRSAPIAYALHDADKAGRLRLHVRLDERAAAFTALGLAKLSDTPVPVVTTSGTAAANLHPAITEASYAEVPIIAMTADRPPELRSAGANQTVDQLQLFGSEVRFFHEVGVPEERVGSVAYWRSLVCRTLAAARGTRTLDPGPVHLNLPFREPLVPDSGDWIESLDGRDGGARWTVVDSAPIAEPPAVDPRPERTLVVVGDCPPAWGQAAVLLAEGRGWPVIAEPCGNARTGPNALRLGQLLIDDHRWLSANRPDRIIVVGRPTLWRSVQRLMREPGVSVEIASPSPWWPDAPRLASRVHAAVPHPGDHHPHDDAWLNAWREADAARAERYSLDEWDGRIVATEVMAALPAGSLLVAASSLPVRDLAWAQLRDGVTVVANRGAAGIDGTTSTAVGAALSWQARGGGPAAAYVGDVAFLHDAAGLAIGPDEPRPDLVVVVSNNAGGGLFKLLEQGAPQHAAAFDRLFGTPHGVDIGGLCAATGWAHTAVTDAESLAKALSDSVGNGLRVIEAVLPPVTRAR